MCAIGEGLSVEILRTTVRTAVLTVAVTAVAALFLAAVVSSRPAAAAQVKKPAAKESPAKAAPGKSKKAHAKPASGKSKKANKARGRAAAPAADDTIILRFIMHRTVAVARLDAARLDLDALEAFVGGTSPAAAASWGEALGPVFTALPVDFAHDPSRFRTPLKQFRAAGGRFVYGLLEYGHPAALVVPTGNDRVADAIVPLFQGLTRDPNPAGTWRYAADARGPEDDLVLVDHWFFQVGRGMKVGAQSSRLRADERAHRPDLPAAFAAAGDAVFRVAYLPDEDFRRRVRNAARSPRDGWGGDPELFGEGVRWATLAAYQEPAPRVVLTVRAADAARAAELARWLSDGLARARAEPPPDEETGAAWAKHLPAAEPVVEGETVTLTFAGELLQRGLPREISNAFRTAVALGDLGGMLPRAPAPGAAPPQPAAPAEAGPPAAFDVDSLE